MTVLQGHAAVILALAALPGIAQGDTLEDGVPAAMQPAEGVTAVGAEGSSAPVPTKQSDATEEVELLAEGLRKAGYWQKETNK